MSWNEVVAWSLLAALLWLFAGLMLVRVLSWRRKPSESLSEPLRGTPVPPVVDFSDMEGVMLLIGDKLYEIRTMNEHYITAVRVNAEDLNGSE